MFKREAGCGNVCSVMASQCVAGLVLFWLGTDGIMFKYLVGYCQVRFVRVSHGLLCYGLLWSVKARTAL